MDAGHAQRVIESLRKGIPPDGFVRQFTVGRKTEIDQLIDRLEKGKSGALLLKANYGSGKTHLLRLIREHALDRGFVVSSVTLDSKGAVRFNRMDQIVGAIFRNIEAPSAPGTKGIRPFFDLLIQKIEQAKAKGSAAFWRRLTNDWRWDFSDVLDSPAMFVALRAWGTANSSVHDLVEDWLFQPWVYRTQRRVLHVKLIEKLRPFFRDPRAQWQFYADEVFAFEKQGYAQSWSALRDLHKLARAADLKGLIILFDEFEDVVTNLNNVAHQEAAFWNLFQFYSGKQFPGMSFYAVTPEFVNKCISLLIDKGRWDYDYARFESLPTFQMSPLEVEELEELAMRIMQTHGVAYEWEPDLVMKASQLDAIVRKAAAVQIQDRARHTIISVVKALDDLLDGDDPSSAAQEASAEHHADLSATDLANLNLGSKTTTELKQIRTKLWSICRLTELLKQRVPREWSVALKAVEQQLFSALSPDAAKAVRRRDTDSLAALKDAPAGDWISDYVNTLCSELKALAVHPSASTSET